MKLLVGILLGDRGPAKYCMMTDKWFDEYVYEILINKKYLSEKNHILFGH